MNKKIIALALILVAAVLILSSCGNRQVGIDFAQTFDKAFIKLGNDWKEISIRSWRDFDNGDEVQIVAADGDVYLTHYCNMILVKEQ